MNVLTRVQYHKYAIKRLERARVAKVSLVIRVVAAIEAPLVTFHIVRHVENATMIGPNI